MATIYRALVTSLLVLWSYVVITGWRAGSSEAALAWHLKVGLTGALVGCAIQSLPFAYFLGTNFWIKAFARASSAGDGWIERHKQWMKGRAYPAMYLAPLLTMAVAISGSMVETARLPHALHPTLVVAALLAQVAGLLLVPREMVRNAALMDELADTHRVPRPNSPEMDTLIEREEAGSLPPLFQLSRVCLLFASQCVLVWLYLRFGTETLRGTPFLPFAIGACALLTLGLGLNARYDPDHPAPTHRAWGRALAVGVVLLGASVWIHQLI